MVRDDIEHLVYDSLSLGHWFLLSLKRMVVRSATSAAAYCAVRHLYAKCCLGLSHRHYEHLGGPPEAVKKVRNAVAQHSYILHSCGGFRQPEVCTAFVDILLLIINV